MFKFIVIPVLIMVAGAVGCKNGESAQKTESSAITNDQKIVSYRLGFDHANIIFQDMPGIDPQIMCEGIKDAKTSPLNPKYSDKEFTKSLAVVRKDKARDMIGKRFAERSRNLPVSKKFLEENKLKEGVTTMENGLQIKVIQEGEGDPVTLKDVVIVHYQGWDANEKLFDSSFVRKNPTKFELNMLIAGLQEGLQMMKKGGKYHLWVPPELGYGDKGFKNRVEAGMALFFEIEIIDIERGASKSPEMKPDAKSRKNKRKKK